MRNFRETIEVPLDIFNALGGQASMNYIRDEIAKTQPDVDKDKSFKVTVIESKSKQVGDDHFVILDILMEVDQPLPDQPAIGQTE